MEIKMTLNEFATMLNRLQVSHIAERINDDIIHIKIIKNNNMFRMKFVDKGFGFEFNNFYEN